MDETTETAVFSRIHIVDDIFPGPKTRAALERGIPLFRNGLRFDAEMERAGRRGFRPVRQIVVDRTEGDVAAYPCGNAGF